MCQQEIQGEQGDAPGISPHSVHQGCKEMCVLHLLAWQSGTPPRTVTCILVGADETHGPARTQKPVNHIFMFALIECFMVYHLAMLRDFALINKTTGEISTHARCSCVCNKTIN